MWNLNGFDVRFSYDSTKIQPSNLITNEITDDETRYFEFEDEFKESLDFFTIPYDKEGSGVLGTLSLNPPIISSEHIIQKEGTGYVVNTDGGVLLGKMSFQMTADTFDVNWFQLEENSESYPTTGIKINIDGRDNYQAKSTFRFTDQTASRDADLSNIILSTGKVDEVNPENSTYKEYAYTPDFHKETLDYELTLLEYVDKMNLTVTKSHEKASLKIKVPKRDEDNKLVYDTDGTTIIYEEKEIEDKVPTEITINKLGEPDTKITIIVTAEDGSTKEYNIIIKRPYGTIKGSIYTAPTANAGIYKSDIRIYKASDVSQVLDWDTIVEGKTDNVHETLLTLKSEDRVTNDDGTYEVYVIPGTYDILLDKPGYLDHIYTSKVVIEGDIIDLGHKELFAGDVNKDGVVQLKDLDAIVNTYGIDDTDSNYDICFDFNEDKQIQLQDLDRVVSNYSLAREIN